MTKECLRGAIVGFGNVAIHAHLPAWRASNRFRIDAVLEPHSEQVEIAKDLLPRSPVYSEIDPLLAENALDFVDICTPPCFHGNLILKACRAGLHVFCEKPLVTSFERLQEIERAAKDFSRVIFTVNNWKYAPLWMKAIELVRSNRIGVVRSISLTVLRPSHSGGGVSNWRRCAEIAGGGILVDHGWHQLYLILSMMREPPVFISAHMEFAHGTGPPQEETVDLVMRFPGGEAKLHLTWRASCRRNYGLIRGDEGTLFINDDHLILCVGSRPAMRYDFPEALSGSSHHPEWMKPVIEGFLHEVQDASARGDNLGEARWCTKLTHLAYQSHREGSRFIPVGNLTT
jgi:predicted dehydrogenase